MTNQEIIADAISKHPDCSFGVIYNGVGISFPPRLFTTRVVKLWRNEECYLCNDPPKYTVDDYPGS